MSKKLLFPSDEWNIEQVYNAWDKISKIARKELQLDFYDTEINIITYEQALALEAGAFLPTNYSHWSFGKNYVQHKDNYVRGKENLPYEVIINTNPTIMYLLENNTATMQMLTLSHAGCGHGAVFKNNFLFKSHTDPEFILPYMNFANTYIRDCEDKYGPEEVEMLLDACHSLRHHGIFKYPRRQAKKGELAKKEQYRVEVAAENYKEDHHFSDFKSQPHDEEVAEGEGKYPERERQKEKFNLPQENLLYFIEKHSLSLATWEKEVVRIVRRIAQYFYPQYQTKLLHEGYAAFVHYELMCLLYDKKLMTEGQFLEFLHNHTNVLTQPDLQPNMNPYKLGFEIFSNIKKVCINPSKDDYYWFPDIAGTKDYMAAINFAMANFIDESLILQYLSVETVEKLQMFSIMDDSQNTYIHITNIQNERDFRELRKQIANKYAISKIVPHIEIIGCNEYTHNLTLQARLDEQILEEDDYYKVKDNLRFLTGYDKIEFVT